MDTKPKFLCFTFKGYDKPVAKNKGGKNIYLSKELYQELLYSDKFEEDKSRVWFSYPFIEYTDRTTNYLITSIREPNKIEIEVKSGTKSNYSTLFDPTITVTTKLFVDEIVTNITKYSYKVTDSIFEKIKKDTKYIELVDLDSLKSKIDKESKEAINKAAKKIKESKEKLSDKKLKRSLIQEFFCCDDNKVKDSISIEGIKIVSVKYNKYDYWKDLKEELVLTLELSNGKYITITRKLPFKDLTFLKEREQAFSQLHRHARRGTVSYGESPDGRRSAGSYETTIHYSSNETTIAKTCYYRLPSKVTDEWWNVLVANSTVAIIEKTK